jgi:hypothetical protein
LQTVLGDRYLVAHEEPGQRGGQPRYTCLQFVMRAPDVFQIRVAPVSDRMDRSLCQDSSLQLDPWLIVDRNHLGRERAPCPLVGGFSMHIFDKVSQRIFETADLCLGCVSCVRSSGVP